MDVNEILKEDGITRREIPMRLAMLASMYGLQHLAERNGKEATDEDILFEKGLAGTMCIVRDGYMETAVLGKVKIHRLKWNSKEDDDSNYLLLLQDSNVYSILEHGMTVDLEGEL